MTQFELECGVVQVQTTLVASPRFEPAVWLDPVCLIRKRPGVVRLSDLTKDERDAVRKILERQAAKSSTENREG